MFYSIAILLILIGKKASGDLFITYKDKVGTYGVYRIDIYYVDNETNACNHIDTVVMDCKNCSNNIKFEDSRVTYNISDHSYKVNTVHDSRMYTIFNPISELPSNLVSDHFFNTIYLVNSTEAAIVSHVEESSVDFNISNKYGDVLYIGWRKMMQTCLPNSTPHINSYYYLEDKKYLGSISVAINVPQAHITAYFLQTCEQKCPNNSLSIVVMAIIFGIMLGIGCIFYACLLHEVNQCIKGRTLPLQPKQ
jgi:hypothetical protein